jgi:hypothetical protein
MSGVTFVVDQQGRKKAVLIDLEKHGDLWEDFYDALVVKSRQKDPRETLASVEKRLSKRHRG